MTDTPAALDPFFHPASMAVIGASESLGSYGARYLQALTDIGFAGRLYAVNHSGECVLGHKIYRSVLDIPDSVDLVALCVPGKFVPPIMQECLEKKVKAAIVLSAGFSEAGEEGRALEEEVLKIARQGVRLMGPNCFGTYCPGGGVTIVPGGWFPKEPGGVSLIAQSGQLSEGITSRAFGEGIRFAKVASFGNAANLNEADLLEYLMEDGDTQVFTAYLEGVRDGRRFFEIARENAGRKPILLWKVGLTRMGATAAASHTGSLAGQSEVWDAFFRQTRAIKIGSLEELVDTAVGFSCLPEGCGSRVALISGGGAGTVVGADACEAAGMEMPPLSSETEARLRELLPPFGTSIKNPLDIGNPHPPLQLLRDLLEALAASERFDVILIRRIFFSVKVSMVFSGTTAPSAEEQQALLDIPVEVMKKYGKPVVIILPEELTGVENIDMEEERRQIRDFYFARNIPVFTSEQRAFVALSNLAKFNASIAEKAAGIEDTKSAAAEAVSEGSPNISDILATADAPVLDEIRSKRLFKACGLEVTLPVLAKTKEDAIAAAEALEYPVALKIVSPQITHKSDIGGVKIGLRTPKEVESAFETIMTAAADKAPDAVVEGVSVQKMAPAGLELVAGMTKDSQFGPMIMFGLGGTHVEVLKDVAFGIAPLTRKDAAEMSRSIRAWPLLNGYRGNPPVDTECIERWLMSLSDLAMRHPEIREMDVNPLVAGEKGAVAVDARVILEEDAVKIDYRL